MSKQLLMSIGGEGEGLDIYSMIIGGETKFIVGHWNMFDDDDLPVVPDNQFNSFAEAFSYIKNRYRSWFRLHISRVHPDYREMIDEDVRKARESDI